MTNVVELKVLNPLILEYGLPSTETLGSAGRDLRAALDKSVVISPGETAIIPTGVAIFIQDRSIAGFVMPRSGLAANFQVTLQNSVGLIDSDYQGELKVLLRNEGFDSYKVNPGDRIAQLVFVPVIHPMISVITSFSGESVRGVGGFGSTGIGSRPLHIAAGEVVDSEAGLLIPTHNLGNDDPLVSGVEASVTPMYPPTGQELLEAAYGDED